MTADAIAAVPMTSFTAAVRHCYFVLHYFCKLKIKVKPQLTRTLVPNGILYLAFRRKRQITRTIINGYLFFKNSRDVPYQ